MAICWYPIKQWYDLMYMDKNPSIQYMCCQLCNEPFNLYERIVLPFECEARNDEREDAERHYFHVACIDIIYNQNLREDDESSKLKSSANSVASAMTNRKCIVCETKKKQDEFDQKEQEKIDFFNNLNVRPLNSFREDVA